MRDAAASALLRYPGAALRRCRALYWQALGASVGKGCWLGAIEIPRSPWDVWLGDEVALDRGVILLATGPRTATPRIRIHDRCYVNRYTMIDASSEIEIGQDCMIGPFCYITDHDHGVGLEQRVADQPLVAKPTRIGRDVWIGASAVILKGVQVGDQAIIAAGAVVTKNVESQVTVAGVPARPLARR
jgi:maltose O-acetyltransferase